MNEDELNKLEKMLGNLIECSSKSEAKKLFDELNFNIIDLADTVNPYHFSKLEDAISYAFTGSGQVNNKDHYRSLVKNSWSKFRKSASN